MAEFIDQSYLLPSTPAALLEALRDPEVVARRAAGSHVLSHSVGDGDSDPHPTVEIEARTDIPLSWLPPLIQSRLPEPASVTRTERWQQADESHLTAEQSFRFTGVPARCTGRSEVHAEGSGSRLTVQLSLTVDLPLVSGLVERAVAPQIVRSLDEEAAFYAGLGEEPGS